MATVTERNIAASKKTVKEIISYCLETVKPANDASPEDIIARKLITTLL